jgi:tetratricopeptide (TPR) repeat protein
MAKKKTNKSIQFPQSPESQIRTRARKLKIGKCYISEEWEGMREGNIIITREHSNGNLSMGMFLVDLALLGVTDTIYGFNMPPYEFQNMLDSIPAEDEKLVEIDYVLAHNIIYSAVEYAEDFGFRPCKEFNVAKYLLEEDTKKIPLIEIELGVKGFPTVICNEDNPKIKEIEQLKKAVGTGNFKVIDTDIIPDDEIFFDDESESIPGWDDDIEAMGVPDWDEKHWMEYLKQDPQNCSIRVLQYYVDMVFLEINSDKNLDAFEYVLGGASYSDSLNENIFPKEEAIIDEVFEKLCSKNINSIPKILEKAQKEYPESLTIKLLSILQQTEKEDKDKAEKIFKDFLEQYPNNISILNIYAGWLIENGNTEKIPELFRHKCSLKEFQSDKEFSTNEVIDFCQAYCSYFMAIDDLWGAEPYYEVLDTLDDNSPMTKQIICRIVFEKMRFLSDLLENKA